MNLWILETHISPSHPVVIGNVTVQMSMENWLHIHNDIFFLDVVYPAEQNFQYYLIWNIVLNNQHKETNALHYYQY